MHQKKNHHHHLPQAQCSFCAVLLLKLSSRCADNVQEKMEKRISCSVGCLAFRVSIGFIYPEKLHINISQSRLCSNREEEKRVISQTLKGTESLLEGGQSGEEQREIQPGMLLLHTTTSSGIASNRFPKQPHTWESTNNNHKKISHQGQIKFNREDKNRLK